jgi:hypothetical protein
MSNPLLKPNDPRFQPPAIVDGQGNNRFADPEQAEDAKSKAEGVYSVSAAAGQQPYAPRYERSARSRGVLLLVLAIVGLSGPATGMLAMSGVILLGWVFPLCAIAPATAAWLLARSDLSEMKHGGRDDSDQQLTQAAMWLGIVGLVACLASVGSMIWLGLSLLPNFL